MKQATRKPTTAGDVLLYEYLEPLDLKINDLAEMLNVQRNTVSALVNNNRKLTPDMAFRLAVVFDVWSYATGERGAERARHGFEQAGAEFERAAAPVVVRLNGIEAHREQARAAQHQKALELERSQRQRTYNGPSL